MNLLRAIAYRLSQMPGVLQGSILGPVPIANNKPELKINDSSTDFINNILKGIGGGTQTGNNIPNTQPVPSDAASLIADMPGAGMYGGQAGDIPNMVKNLPSPSGDSGIAGAIQKAGQAAGNFINNYAKTLPPPVAQKPPVDPLADITDLYKQMLGNMGGGVTMQSPETLRALAEKQIALEYNPQIAALQQEMKERKSRYAANKQELLDLWGSLSDSYSNDADLSNASYDALMSDGADNSDLEGLINQHYNDATGYMDDQFSKLGIEDTSAYTDPMLSQGYDDVMGRLNESQGSYEDLLSANESAADNYMSGMADTARMHGAEGAENLMDELNYYLDSANSNLTSLRSQKGTSLELLVQQMLQQQQQAQAAAQQQQFDNLMKAAQFRLDMQNMANGMNKQQEQPIYTNGLLGANQQFAGSPNATQLSGILQELMQRPEFIENSFIAGDGVTRRNMNPQKAAQLALQEAQKRGLSQADTMQLINAMYAYYGKLGTAQ